MKTIRDPIHGSISLADHELSILDTPEFQRLRRVKQLGFTYLVYPSATHTRFEHGLGALFVAHRLGKSLDLDNDSANKIRLAALLHDVGHGPFSHVSEDALQGIVSVRHEEYSEKIIKSSAISEIIEDAGYNPAEIADISRGKNPPFGDMVSSQIDVDRMDYLIRDAYYTGAAYGVIDLDRLLQTARINEDHLVFDIGGLSAIEGLLIARYLMFPSVYNHHTTRIVDVMYAWAVASCVKDKLIEPDHFFRMDDAQLLAKIKSMDNKASELIHQIESRNLYKRALVFDSNDLEGKMDEIFELKNDPKRFQDLVNKVTETCNLSQGEVLLDIPRKWHAREAGITILTKSDPKPLREVSPLVKSLENAQLSHWDMAVYSSKENMEKVGKAAKDELMSLIL